MNILDAKDVLHAAALVDDSVLMCGPHGIGKSQIVEQFSEESDFFMYPLFLSHQEVGDIIGIPSDTVVDGEKVTTWSVPIWLKRMREVAKTGKRCVLFLDELNRAPLDVRQSALQLVLEGKIHEHELPVTPNGEKTIVVSAVNPADEYQVDELDPALLDRFTDITVEACVTTWLKYASVNNLSSVVRDFLAEFPDRLHFMPTDGGRGPTPRSWTKLAKYMEKADKIPENILFGIMKGRLGKEVASQFYTYFKNYVDVVKMEDIEEYVENNEFNTIEEYADGIAELMSKAEAIQKTEMADKLLQKYGNKAKMLPFLAFLYSLEIEICVAFLKKMKSDNPKQYSNLAKIDGELNNKELFKRIVIAAQRG